MPLIILASLPFLLLTVYFVILHHSAAPLEVPTTGSTDRVPLRTPTSPRPDNTRVPSPPRTSHAADTSAPGSGAGNEDSVMTDTPGPDPEANLGASSSAPEIERTEVPEDSEQPQPQQQQQPEPQPMPPPPTQQQQKQKQQPPAPTPPAKPQPPPTQPQPRRTSKAPVPATGKTVSANPDRQLTVPPSQGAPVATSSSIQTASWGFAPLRTLSRKSLGSLEGYNMEIGRASCRERVCQYV